MITLILLKAAEEKIFPNQPEIPEELVVPEAPR